MLSALARFFLFLVGILFINRFLGIFSGRRRKGAPPSPAPGPAQTAMVRDPICGMYLDPRLAVRLDRKKETLYFCSNECQRAYEQGAGNPKI